MRKAPWRYEADAEKLEREGFGWPGGDTGIRRRGMALSREILDLVEKTPFVDTHEHLIEESARVESLTGTDPKRPPTDFSVFFAHYANSDLVVAGMSMEEHERLFAHDTPLDEKWRIVAPVYAR